MNCTSCGGPAIRNPTTTEVECQDCGLILEGPEIISSHRFEGEERKIVGSAPTRPLRPGKGLGTDDRFGSRDHMGRPVKGTLKMTLLHSSRLVHRAIKGKDKTWNVAVREIEGSATKMSLPRGLEEEALGLFREAMTNRVVRGRSARVVAVACLYMVQRHHNLPCSLVGICKKTGVSRKVLGRTYRKLIKIVNAGRDEPMVPLLDEQGAIEKAVRMAMQHALSLRLTSETKERLQGLIRSAGPLITRGVSEHTVCASATYLACMLTGDHRTQDRIAAEYDVTAVSVRTKRIALARLAGVEEELRSISVLKLSAKTGHETRQRKEEAVGL